MRTAIITSMILLIAGCLSIALFVMYEANMREVEELRATILHKESHGK